MIQNESWMTLSNGDCCLRGLSDWLCWNTCMLGTFLNSHVSRCPWCYGQITGADTNQLLPWYKVALANHNGERDLLCWDMSRAVWQQYFGTLLPLFHFYGRVGNSRCSTVPFRLHPKPIDRKSQPHFNEPGPAADPPLCSWCFRLHIKSNKPGVLGEHLVSHAQPFS